METNCEYTNIFVMQRKIITGEADCSFMYILR